MRPLSNTHAQLKIKQMQLETSGTTRRSKNRYGRSNLMDVFWMPLRAQHFNVCDSMSSFIENWSLKSLSYTERRESST